MSAERRPRLDVALADVAARQHGLVTRAQLSALGMAASTVTSRLGAGRLHQVHRGVYAVGYAPLTRDARLLAAVLSVGAGAVASHISAAVLWGLLDGDRIPRAGVDVSVCRHPRRRDGVVLHLPRRLPARDVTCRRAIPVTVPARTILDLTDALHSDQLLRRAVRQAFVERLVSERDLRAQLAAAHGRRAACRLGHLLADGPVPTRSELEDRTLALLAAHGLPRPATNARIPGLARRVEVDFLWAEQRVVLEVDGARYHDNRLARADDADRQALVEEAGYRVVRATWAQVTDRGEQTARRVARLLG